ncbi:NAD-dependent epimerase/dehydratase family protein [Sphingomicrobium flavum]|uniref:NAD-dependent epimerase/dehydratase family protein n=1 Tax=Sphingomicrobium flavum TaxID=1229164 RepID=UPI0021ADAAC6|nr:NAD(P)-dependent oxidoreductase [Sphingomicrobium flavum]
MTIAVTGATGFVGQRLLEVAAQRGLKLRALTRRDQPARDGVTWVRGDLEDAPALAELVADTSAIIHIAGVINAPDREGFEVGNVTGTANLLIAAQAANVPRFVHVSSLAAREPDLSLYGGSKARSEALVQQSGITHAIVRPPAVYGPGDRETLELFKMAKRGLVVLPPEGRMSAIHADDLSALLLDLAAAPHLDGPIFEPDDGSEGGFTHQAFAKALGKAVGTDPKTISMPAALVKAGARIDRLFRREQAKLTPDRAAYFCHPNWVVAPDKRPPASLWTPSITTEQGLVDTARWYRDKGWL